MKIATVGLWHLGTITSLGLANLGHEIFAFDENQDVIKNFNSKIPTINEPRILNLLNKYLNKKIKFTNDFNNLKKYNLIYITYDAKINNKDESDFEYLFNKIKKILKIIKKKTLVVITSQIPLGSIKKIENYEKKFVKKSIKFSYLPENYRIGKSIDIFMKPDRLVFGLRNLKLKYIFQKIYSKINCEKIFVSPETAEMSKHVINSFLACSVSFANEIGNIARNYDISLDDLERSVKSDKRIGFKSYLKPGNAFSGGTLGRDLNFLIKLSKNLRIKNNLIRSILKSNSVHSKWIINHIYKNFKSKNCKILQIGLSYTNKTSTIRRSLALDIFNKLKKNYKIKFFDEEYIIKSREIRKYKKYLFNKSKKNDKYDLILIFNNSFDFNLLKKNIKNNTVILDTNNLKDTKKIFKHYRYVSVNNA